MNLTTREQYQAAYRNERIKSRPRSTNDSWMTTWHYTQGITSDGITAYVHTQAVISLNAARQRYTIDQNIKHDLALYRLRCQRAGNPIDADIVRYFIRKSVSRHNYPWS